MAIEQIVKLLFLVLFGIFKRFHCLNETEGVGGSNIWNAQFLHCFKHPEESRHCCIKILEFEKVEKCNRCPASETSDQLAQILLLRKYATPYSREINWPYFNFVYHRAQLSHLSKFISRISDSKPEKCLEKKMTMNGM